MSLPVEANEPGVAENASPKKRLLFLFAKTGGGHLAAAQAVASQLDQFEGEFEVELFDPTNGSKRHIIRRSLRLYVPVVRWIPALWWLIHEISDTRAGTAGAQWLTRKTYVGLLRRKISEFHPDAVVCFHPLLTTAAARAAVDAPVAVVVTDLGSIHRCWLSPQVDLITLPTATAFKAISHKSDYPHLFRDTGLPIRSCFSIAAQDSAERDRLRAARNLDSRFTVLVSGGGEGFGSLLKQAEALLASMDDLQVVLVCGRNQALVRRAKHLQSRFGERLVVLGFVSDMAGWLRIVDVIAAKAGPGTIAEAFASGTPIVMTGAVPGQETGNVEHVVVAGAGLFAPSLQQLCNAISRLRHDAQLVANMKARAKTAARSDATAAVVSEVLKMCDAHANKPKPLRHMSTLSDTTARKRTVRHRSVAGIAAFAIASLGIGVDVSAASEIHVNRPPSVTRSELNSARLEAVRAVEGAWQTVTAPKRR